MVQPATSIAHIPDVLLEDIFLRLPSPADLARASTACPSFHRAITDHAFLRRYRSFHPPPLIGMLNHHKPFVPAQPPHPSAVAARAFAGFDFSCSSFLPSAAGLTWSPIDFFDGRALLTRVPHQYRQFWVRGLAVCDPVHHRYVLLPAVPDDLKSLAPQPALLNLEAFLAPSQNEKDPLSFRVMCLVECTTKLLLLVFSSLGGQGQWHAHTFDQWSGQATFAFDGSSINSHSGLSNRQFVHGCFYWHLHFRDELLVLDVRALEFSAVNLPPEQPISASFFMVEAADGTLGMLTKGEEAYDEDSEEYQYLLTYSIMKNNKWHSEKVIPLPVRLMCLIGVAGGYLLIEWLYASSLEEKPKFEYFSVDVKTFQVELFATLSKPFFPDQLYAGFPPSLCAPTI